MKPFGHFPFIVYLCVFMVAAAVLGCDNGGGQGGDRRQECFSGAYRCVGMNIERCDIDGSWQYLRSCEYKQQCDNGGCVSAGQTDCEFDQDCGADESCIQGSCREKVVAQFSISGTVIDWATGKPLSGARVRLNAGNATTDTTDASGNYKIPVVDEGTYTIAASKQEYVDYSAEISIYGADKQFDISMAGKSVWCDVSFKLSTGETFSASCSDSWVYYNPYMREYDESTIIVAVNWPGFAGMTLCECGGEVDNEGQIILNSEYGNWPAYEHGIVAATIRLSEQYQCEIGETRENWDSPGPLAISATYSDDNKNGALIAFDWSSEEFRCRKLDCCQYTGEQTKYQVSVSGSVYTPLYR